MDNRPKQLNRPSNLPSISSFNHWTDADFEAKSQPDTTLRLVSPGSSSFHGFNLKGTKRKWEEIDGHASLSLGLLYLSSSTSESSKRSSGTVCTASSAYVADEECSVDLDLSFQLKLNADNVNLNQISSLTTSNEVSANPVINLQLGLSVGASVSSITSELGAHRNHRVSLEASTVNFPEPAIDDGAISSYCWENAGSLIPSGNTTGSANLSSQYRPETKSGGAPNSDQFSIFTELQESPVNCTSGTVEKPNRNNNSKKCQSPGCLKGARGASRLCIAHGGGRRCQKAGCQKGAEGRSIYCKAHGGGRRCEHLGCTKSSEGRTAFCIAHGGGRRCVKEDCTRAARGKSGLCIRHGGGKRCMKENCTKSAEGQSGLCIAHGGGKRCQFPECVKGAQGSTMYCKAHGGGKRCSFPQCTKGAEGSTPFCKGHGGGKRCLFQGGGVCTKSVHGGTQFCVAHGGGKRCAVPECTKSARGRTDFCVRHGGGRRCMFEGCGKSAQGSTQFCKAHGGGKRCSWGEAEGHRCDRFARGKLGLCAAHLALVQDHKVHGGETMQMIADWRSIQKDDKMKGTVLDEGDNRIIIPVKSGRDSLPEGRVHGGSLLALLASGVVADHAGSEAEGCSTSDQVYVYTIMDA